RIQFTTLYSLPEVGAECAEACAITKAGEKPRFIDSAMLMMWCPPVRESPAAPPKLSVVPLPPKLYSANSVPCAFHWKTMDFAQWCQRGAPTMMSSSMKNPTLCCTAGLGTLAETKGRLFCEFP